MLILKKDGIVIDRVQPGGWAHLPTGEYISPAEAGWSNEAGFSLEEEPEEPPVEKTLEEKRSEAQISRKLFCLGVKAAGVLTPEEAVDAAKGNLPTPFRDALVAAGIDGHDAEIVWATSGQIWRTDPFIEILAAMPNIGPGVADAIFGIA